MSTMTQNLATVSVTVGDQDMTFETGKLAKQADGSVVVRSGDTMVLATAQGKIAVLAGLRFTRIGVDHVWPWSVETVAKTSWSSEKTA